MKKIFNAILLTGFAAVMMIACQPMDKDRYELGPAVSESQLSFDYSPESSSPNIIDFSNNSSVKGVALWDLGNGQIAKGDKVVAQYPMKGEYTVTMSLYTTGGSTSISKVISIADDDFSLLDTPGYRALTGGADATNGKTWVFARYTKGHFGVGDIKAAPEEGGPAWWQCDPEGKLGCSLYDNTYTFTQIGTKLIWKNNGYIYTNEAGMNHLGIPGIPSEIGDFDVPYVPADDLSYIFDESSMTLTLSGGAFIGFYTGVSEYHITKLDEHSLELWCGSAAEPGNAWYFKLVPADELAPPAIDPKPEPEEAWFRPNAETNLLGTIIDYDSWFSPEDWSGGLEPGIEIRNDIVITVPEGIGGGEWQGQFKIRTDIPADARERFDFSCKLSSTETGVATIKMTAADDPADDSFFYDGNIVVPGGGSTNFEAADHMLYDETESILLVFDFGRFPAGAVITISDLCLQKHIPLSDKPQIVNLWPDADIEVSQWFSPADWSGGLVADYTLLEGNGFKLTVPEGTGGAEWQGQFALHSNIKAKKALRYEFSAKIASTADGAITVKVTSDPEEDDAHLISYDNSVRVIGGSTVSYRIKNVYPKPQDADALMLVFDFGRMPAGTEITVTDIVFQEYID